MCSPWRAQGMRIQQRKKRNEPSERSTEPNDKLGDVKPLLTDAIVVPNTTAIAREANRKQARDGMKLRPAIQKMPVRGQAYNRARPGGVGQPRQGF